MEALQLLGFAFAAGLVVSGTAATLMELATGRVARFAPPFAHPDRIVRSLAAVFVAGPTMLFAHALEERRRGVIGPTACGVLAVGAAGWALALGVVTIELVWLASLPLPD